MSRKRLHHLPQTKQRRRTQVSAIEGYGIVNIRRDNEGEGCKKRRSAIFNHGMHNVRVGISERCKGNNALHAEKTWIICNFDDGRRTAREGRESEVVVGSGKRTAPPGNKLEDIRDSTFWNKTLVDR
ncbi:hypothetical protein M405DRAFT_884427 [Rhizopogon salebrosus TDB-379]|nr:hypothetical protein M405DRAFT_884427 [Rhizopogon salebrosus TDB-379]